MQTTSGKVKLATAEEVDNMASTYGGKLVCTASAYIDSTKSVTLNTACDYVIIRSITKQYATDENYPISTNSAFTLLYKGCTGYIAAAAAAVAAAAAAALDASGKTIKFTSMINSYNLNTYVNIEAYKFN